MMRKIAWTPVTVLPCICEDIGDVMEDFGLLSVDEVNGKLVNELDGLASVGYTSETRENIQRIFEKIRSETYMNSLEVEDVLYIEPDVKVEYICQGRHFTLIMRVKGGEV